MRPLSAAGVLELADRLVGGASPEDALAVLQAVYPETPREELAGWPLGLRDARLLEVRRHTLSAPLELGAVCPACGEEVEVGLDPEELARPAETAPQGGTLALGDLTLRFRPVTTGDLLAVRHEPTTESAAAALVGRIVSDARRGGVEIAAGDLTAAEVEALAEHLAAADPAAEIRLTSTCPGCERSWAATFDPASFLADELRRLAGRILAEVHVLASAYGWAEADLLAMSGRRRRAYLEMLGA